MYVCMMCAVRVCHRRPRCPQGPVAGDTAVVPSAEIFLVQPAFASPARLLSVRTYGASTGTCSGEVRPQPGARAAL